MPKQSQANPSIKLEFVNGHFAYAYKLGLLTNGSGIPIGVTFFDDDFYEPFLFVPFQTLLFYNRLNLYSDRSSHDNGSLLIEISRFCKKTADLAKSVDFGNVFRALRIFCQTNGFLS